ncbi:MAG: SPOR domain-containing protein [Cyclobacteriaceae bacterium]|nr:SPOR domain-containing protein [Cyclobacteriaceae bacterium]
MRTNLVIGLFCHFLMGCVAQKANDQDYYENLSALRPVVTVPIDTPYEETKHVRETDANITPTKTVNAKVDAVLDSIDRYNLVRKFVDGYTIQIYSGQNREEAMDSKKKMSLELPDMTANLQYQQPKFRVTVGRYYTKLEAHEDLVRLRTSFAAAILVPEKIQIK